MLSQIRQRDSRLERYRQFLEQQVEERTVNLANANRELQQAIAEATTREGGGGTREQRQERIPREDEPRDPHADERRDGNVRAPAGNGALGAPAAAGADHHALGRGAAARSSTTSWISRRSKPASSSSRPSSSACARSSRRPSRSWEYARARKDLELRCVIESSVPAAVRGDPGAAAAGARQSGRQRHQIHRVRRGNGARAGRSIAGGSCDSR